MAQKPFLLFPSVNLCAAGGSREFSVLVVLGSEFAPKAARHLFVGINLSATLDIISVKRRSFTKGDDETDSSLHTNIAHVTVHSSFSMWDTAQSVAV